METELNSAGISPADSKAYATTFIKDKGYFLIRHDANGVEFVAKLPAPSTFDKDAVGYNTAAFSLSGAYYLATKGKVQHMLTIEGLDSFVGHAGHDSPGLPDLSDSDLRPTSLGATSWIADMAVVPLDLDGSGQIADYAFMLDRDGDMYVVKVGSPSNTVWKLKASADGLVPAKAEGFGAAWSYEDKIFFASNVGRGIYEVDLASIDLNALTVDLKWVGKSDPTTNNDGMNCLASVSPWPEQGDCADGFVEVDAVDGVCPTGSTQK